MNTRRMSLSDLEWATELLTEAFDGHLPVIHMFREPKARNKLAYFMRCGCKYALLYGESHSTDDRQGVALWLVPGATHMTPGRMFRAGMFTAPFRFGLRDSKAFGAFVGHTDKVHRQAVTEDHYYLLTLGVAPPSQGTGAGGRLLRVMLKRADNENRPVYLETQRPENVPIYERFGFHVASETTIPGVELLNWGMVRRPGE